MEHRHYRFVSTAVVVLMSRFSETLMTTARTRVQEALEQMWRELEWQKAWLDYRRAGYPFGISWKGLRIWMSYAQKTTSS
jgi:hypothetical protein